MTGYGEARGHSDELAVLVEVRSINSRYFKLNVRLPEGFSNLESRIDALIRRHIRRGSVQVSLRIDRATLPDDYRINAELLTHYQRQIESLAATLHQQERVSWDTLLELPGVIEESDRASNDLDAVWPIIESALSDALTGLSEMRAAEGTAMASDLESNCETITVNLSQIEVAAPKVAESYRDRLKDRLNGLLGEHGVTVDTSDIVREVGLFAERSDISEEIVRLKSHLTQFGETMQRDESPGRRLDFLTQEMFREINTIGSKANDAEIATHVVEIKASIERMREMIQNIE